MIAEHKYGREGNDIASLQSEQLRVLTTDFISKISPNQLKILSFPKINSGPKPLDKILYNALLYSSTYDTYCTANVQYISSIPYTIECEDSIVLPISKSIDIKKDTQMNELNDNRPAHIYFKRTDTSMPEYDDVLSEQLKSTPVRVAMCHAWSDMVNLLKDKPKTICVNADELRLTSCIEIVNMVNTLAKLASMDKITITLGVNKNTTMLQVKEAQKSEMFGIVPSSLDFGPEETLRALYAQWNHIPYWPKHILDQLPGNKKVVRKSPEAIQLTPRQTQILSLIRERGASNKTIAKTLNIAESTVKLHVGIVLKKYGVKNRTQLALFSK